MFKVGIVGCGGVGSMHASCYEALEGVKLAAVASTDEQQLKEIGEKYKIKTYFSAKELIFDPELDIIDICLPTFLHTEYAIMAMEAGKNVFIEKPVCLTPEEADKLLDAQLKEFKQEVDSQIAFGVSREKAIFNVLKHYIKESKPLRFDGNGYSEDWKKEAQ
ncbi:MAG: Gfo/Idh/MocA family oxidoreductase, partial [Oscillospiraceae bacterium]|nr:Gfo/Idh/MocA family oxidoreductase [Oscillospiraceae bacterium]